MPNGMPWPKTPGGSNMELAGMGGVAGAAGRAAGDSFPDASSALMLLAYIKSVV